MTMPSRYVSPTGPEAETEPGSRGRVLRNLLSVARKSEIDRIEHDALLRAQTKYQHDISQDTRFTSKLICGMHQDWLGKIYEWAGRYRTVELEKEGFRWPPRGISVPAGTFFSNRRRS